jgi:hypothetical protein
MTRVPTAASKDNYAGGGTFYLDQGLVITSTKIGGGPKPDEHVRKVPAIRRRM